MEHKTLFVDVILPISLPRMFTYRVPELLNLYIKPLQRVVVPFGKNKRYSAIIHRVHDQAPKDYQAKYLDDILDTNPAINEAQLKFWEWMASYYMCTLGEVMNAALPAGLKLSSETLFTAVYPFEEVDKSSLSDREYLILEALDQVKELRIKDVEGIAGIKTVYPIIKSMMEKQLIIAHEEVKQVFKQKTVSMIKLSEDYQGDEILQSLLNSLSRAPKQQELVIAYLSSFPGETGDWKLFPKAELIAKTGKTASSAINQLIKKEIFVAEQVVVSRLSGNDEMLNGEFQLTEAQQNALDEIYESFAESKPALLFGITGSGKTEVYLKLIDEQIRKGKQVLYILPEIALTAQIIQRLRKIFGRKVQIYHSKFSENERVEVWKAVSEAEPDSGMIVLGARSSLFLPFKNLGLIIVDEEHESTFKQYEPNPKYHARDSALVLAKFSKADILLGSATPSLESYYNAKTNKYKLVRLTERFGNAVLPEIQIIDLQEDTKKRKMKGLFSSRLDKEITDTLKRKKQIILFQNRRGFSPMIECQKCHWVPHCVQCDISLTYHKAIHQLKCHYCGFAMNVPSHCQECNSTDLQMKGFGTEKIEEELLELHPDVSASRMDLDTTRSKYAYHRIIDDFDNQRVQVLIGTQMVSKGLDFENVELVSVLSADAMLNFPDFRAFERSFQLISQVAGRAGRRNALGKVLVQTWKPGHEILASIKNHDYEGFYKREIQERQAFSYPPFSRIIHVTLKHIDQRALDPAADALASWLRSSFGERVLGPEYPPVARIRNMFQKRMLLKIENEASLSKVKLVLREQTDNFFEVNKLKAFRLVIDVDPL